MRRFTKTHANRLMNVAVALLTAREPAAFNMGQYGWPKLGNEPVPSPFSCGTPACALGHYAARPDLQSKFQLGTSDGGGAVVKLSTPGRGNKKRIDFDSNEVMDHFGIDDEEAYDLFDSGGCGGAATAPEAAAYIARFVERKRAVAVKRTA